jgi:DNA primase catalytic core
MSLHKLTAGDGYTYLTRQVAAADATHRGHEALGDFYAARGESPGVWIGTGLSGLAGIEAGEHVSAGQMKALFGKGRHPNADTISAAMIAGGHSPAQALRASKLGRGFYSYDNKSPFRVEVARRFAEHNKERGLVRGASIAAEVRARIRTDVGTQMFMDWHGRPPADAPELSGFIAGSSRKAKTAVAGYDLTFSPVKSVSALWAVAPPEVAAQIQEAHRDAVANTLGWLEREAVFTRDQAQKVRQIEVTGLIAAAFTHRDARSGDPDLHTHVAVSNKVQTLNGTWLALDGRVLFQAIAAAGERYNTRVEVGLIARLGVRFEPRSAIDTFKAPIREVVGVDPVLNAHWSSRRAAIVVRLGVLSAAFQVDHARCPTTTELGRLAQRANLETRPAKHSPCSYADQRATWWAQATQVLGGDSPVAKMVVAATGSRQPNQSVPTQSLTEQWVGQAAARVVARVSLSRPTWQVWHVRAEAERVARTAGVALADVDGAVDRVVAAALSPAHAVALPSSAHIVDRATPLSRGGSGGYTAPGAARFISRAASDTEAYPLQAAQPADRPGAVAGMARAESAALGVTLSPDQAQPAVQSANIGTPVAPALAPRGPGRPAGTPTRNNTEPCRDDRFEVEAGQEALFHAARQREYAPAPDLDAFETERQLVEANRWEHAPVPRARLLQLNEMAADFFTAGYAHSWGPAYVSGRLGTDLADHGGFRPGYAPAGWTALTDHLRGLGGRDEEILAAGLGRVARTGSIIDQFRDRLVMPICNGGQVHGFIGRRHPGLADHGKAGPKYLNTPATDLFDKGAQFFGLTEGQAALEAGATPVLVEGFFDAIAVTLAAGGAHVGLATLGTSLTAAQAGTLRPYIGAQRPGVTVATDADLPGEIAARRAFWMLTARGDTPAHLAMAAGRDPAEVLQVGGPSALRGALREAQPLGRHLLDERLNHAGDTAQMLGDCAAIIAALPPHTWMEQIDHAAALMDPAAGTLRQAVASAAARWTIDPLGSAQAQIGGLTAVRDRLQRAALMPLPPNEQPDLLARRMWASSEPVNGRFGHTPSGSAPAAGR